jgi:hypothetical protein
VSRLKHLMSRIRAFLTDHILQVLASVVLALFGAVWTWVGFKLLGFDPTTQHPKLEFTDAQVAVAGCLASAVAAGTASVLGIEIQKQPGSGLAKQVSAAATSSPLLLFGIGLYAAVGIFVLLVWFFNSTESADMIGAFSLGVLGWLAGAFAAVFAKEAAN